MSLLLTRDSVNHVHSPARGRPRPDGVTDAAAGGILYVVGQLGTGGAERQLVYLLQAIQRKRYRPAVAVWNYREDEFFVSQIHSLNVPIHALAPTRTTRATVATKLLALRRLIERMRPEVVHSYSFFTNFGVYLATRRTAAVAIGSVRGDYLEDLKSAGPFRGAVNSYWPRSQIFNSHAALNNARIASRSFGPRDTSVVCNALDVGRFAQNCRVVPVLPGSGIILGVGSLSPLKRWDRLVRAVLALKERNVDCRVEIVGDGPMRSSIESLATELGVADRVLCRGHVSAIEDRLNASSLLAHPSDSEGCPNAVMEAMAAGLPVVAMGSGDVPRVVEHGVTGFVVDRGDDASFINYLEKLLTTPSLQQEMGVAGRLKAQREFGLERLVSETLTAYRTAGWQDPKC